MVQPLFHDRYDAGRQLGKALRHYAHAPDLLVLGLPRGGVPVAFEVAQALNAPLDIVMVRKLGVPGHDELAMGALASGGVMVWNEAVMAHARPRQAVVDTVIERERRELERRESAYRGTRPHPTVTDHTVIVIDDGLATGASMRATLAALRKQQPRQLVAAVPVAAAEICAELRDEVDDVVCVATPKPFMAVGHWYDDFSPTTDEEVRELLGRTRSRSGEEALS